MRTRDVRLMQMSTTDRTEEFVRLLLGCEPRIYGYIRTLVRHRADAEEILQETALVLWRNFDQFQRGTDFANWALRTAHLTTIAHRRRAKREAISLNDSTVEAVAKDALAMSDRLEDIRRVLALCIAKLPNKDRELIERRYSQETTTQNIAAEFGRPPSTIYNALQRIRRSVRECIQRTLASEARA